MSFVASFFILKFMYAEKKTLKIINLISIFHRLHAMLFMYNIWVTGSMGYSMLYDGYYAIHIFII